MRALSTSLYTTDVALSTIGTVESARDDDDDDDATGENKKRDKIAATTAAISAAQRELVSALGNGGDGDKIVIETKCANQRPALVASTTMMQDLSRACFELSRRMRCFAKEVNREVTPKTERSSSSHHPGLGIAVASLAKKAKAVDSLFRDAKAAREAVESMAWAKKKLAV